MVIKVGQRDKKQKSKYKKENVFFTIGWRSINHDPIRTRKTYLFGNLKPAQKLIKINHACVGGP
jgi:hypothetical protein